MILLDIGTSTEAACACTGGCDVTFWLTNSYAPGGVTWSITPPALPGGASIVSTTPTNLVLQPGSVTTTYTIRAAAVANTNCSEETELEVVPLRITPAATNVCACSNACEIPFAIVPHPAFSNGVTWTLEPAGLSGGATKSAETLTNLVIMPGAIGTSYTVTARSVGNPDCVGTAAFSVLVIDIAQAETAVCVQCSSACDITLNLTTNSYWGSGGVSWDSSPPGITGTTASIVFDPAALSPTMYVVRAHSTLRTNCFDTCTVRLAKTAIVQSNEYALAGATNNVRFNLPGGSWTNVAWTISPDLGASGARFAMGPTGAGTSTNASGTNVWVWPGYIPTGYVIRAQAEEWTSCFDVAGLTVFTVRVTNIRFNYDTNSSSTDALNIRRDYTTQYDIANGEWIDGVTNLPACYTASKSVSIKVKFTVAPASITSADIWGTSTDTNGSLGSANETTVTFANGTSSPEWVSFEIGTATPNCVKKTMTDVWQWRVENVDGSGSAAYDLDASGPHTVYTILADPLAPWSNLAGSLSNAWVSALEFVISDASCGGDSTGPSALAHITGYLHGSVFGMTYDTSFGASHYGMSLGTNGNFNLTDYIGGGGTVNCYDQAAGVTVCARLLGVSPEYLFLDPFGYIYATDLVGVGQCNNPFYPGCPPPYNTALLGTNGMTDLVWTNRSGFGNHAFVRHSGSIYDGTCGPHVGTETLTQYATNSIDISSPAERMCPYFPSPDSSGNGDGVISDAEVNAATTGGDVSKLH